MRRFLLSGVALLAFGGVANAVTLASGPVITSAGAAAPAGTGVGPDVLFGPGGAVGGLSDGAGNPVPLIPFTSFGGPVTITVNDCCLNGDVYQVAVDGLYVGQTIGVPMGPPVGTNATTASTGSFTLPLLAGLHTLGIEDILLSYEGFSSPFGGGVVPAGGPGTGNPYDPAGLTFSVDETITRTPEPISLATLGVGLVGLGVARRRWRKK
jgi:hypothetical protein